MTLIITELSTLGIAMTADTAITWGALHTDGLIKDRSFKGLRKIIPVKKINAGISYWGWTNVEKFGDVTSIFFDEWLSNFLIQHDKDYNNIEELVHLLEPELNRIIPEIPEEEFKEIPFGNGGVHVAGYTEFEGKKVPTMWHIHNGKSQAIPDGRNPRKVHARNDCDPKNFIELSKKGYTYTTRNGEIERYVKFFIPFYQFIQDIQKSDQLIIPMPDLLARAYFWKAQIQFLSQMLSISGQFSRIGRIEDIAASIGNEITILTITSSGITNYFTTE
jgi:hypothetical protein